MKVERRTVGTVEVCAPTEALVDDVVQAFHAMLESFLKGPNPRAVVDMTEVSYMDSAALEVFADAAEELAQRSAQLKLASVTPTCREILELTGMSPRFQFFNDVDAAVRSYL